MCSFGAWNGNIIKEYQLSPHLKNKDQVFLLLGGNMGEVAETFRKARNEIGVFARIVRQSSLYQTQAWGMDQANDFLNQALLVTTDLTPANFLQKLEELESRLGRDLKSNTGKGYQPRPLDIDILFWGEEIINREDLTIPHPRLHVRNFTLAPLNEIAPDFIHPKLHIRIGELLEKSSDQMKVKKL